MLYYFQKYCKDIENVENFEKAKADDFKGWHCHHRLETYTSDGERRLVDISRKELLALDMYWHRPAEELIFLTSREHGSLHKHSEETKKKLREANKGKTPWNKGKHHTFETRQKIAEANRINRTGRHWYNNGKENKFCYECPDGFVPGRLLILL